MANINEHKTGNVNIPGTLHDTSDENIVAYTGDIYDDQQSKNQSTINAEIKKTIEELDKNYVFTKNNGATQIISGKKSFAEPIQVAKSGAIAFNDNKAVHGEAVYLALEPVRHPTGDISSLNDMPVSGARLYSYIMKNLYPLADISKDPEVGRRPVQSKVLAEELKRISAQGGIDGLNEHPVTGKTLSEYMDKHLLQYVSVNSSHDANVLCNLNKIYIWDKSSKPKHLPTIDGLTTYSGSIRNIPGGDVTVQGDFGAVIIDDDEEDVEQWNFEVPRFCQVATIFDSKQFYIRWYDFDNKTSKWTAWEEFQSGSGGGDTPDMSDYAKKSELATVATSGSYNDLTGKPNTAIYCTCATAAATAAKVVTLDGFTTANLTAGTTLRIKFTNTNSARNPTLNVSGTGEKKIMRYGTTASSNTATGSWYAGSVVNMTYDGTNWIQNDFKSDSNSDTKVAQNLAQNDLWRPLLIGYQDSGSATEKIATITNTTNTVYANPKFQANPAKGILSATTFSGALDGTFVDVEVDETMDVNNCTDLGKTYSWGISHAPIGSPYYNLGDEDLEWAMGTIYNYRLGQEACQVCVIDEAEGSKFFVRRVQEDVEWVKLLDNYDGGQPITDLDQEFALGVKTFFKLKLKQSGAIVAGNNEAVTGGTVASAIADVVHKHGNETIDGFKCFSSGLGIAGTADNTLIELNSAYRQEGKDFLWVSRGIAIPSEHSGAISETENALVTGKKVYETLQSYAKDDSVLHLAGRETVTGLKTFPYLNIGSVFFSDAEDFYTGKKYVSVAAGNFSLQDDTLGKVANNNFFVVTGNNVYHARKDFIRGIDVPSDGSSLLAETVYNCSPTANYETLHLPTDATGYIRINMNITDEAKVVEIYHGTRCWSFRKTCIVEFVGNGTEWNAYVYDWRAADGEASNQKKKNILVIGSKNMNRYIFNSNSLLNKGNLLADKKCLMLDAEYDMIYIEDSVFTSSPTAGAYQLSGIYYILPNKKTYGHNTIGHLESFSNGYELTILGNTVHYEADDDDDPYIAMRLDDNNLTKPLVNNNLCYRHVKFIHWNERWYNPYGY